MKRAIIHASVLYEGKLQPLEVLFDGKILEVGETVDKTDAEIIDGAGLCLLPGLIDTHVHLRDPGYAYKETIETGTRAAAHGGFTTIFAMPNLKPFPSRKDDVSVYLERLEQEALVHVIPFGTITVDEAGKEPTKYEELKELGLTAFSDDGVGVADGEVMKRCMEQAKQADVLFSCHTEDMAYRKPLASVHESEVTAAKGWIGIPSACETSQLVRDLKLVGETGIRYHADHISAKESVEALHQAKAEGLDVTGEVTVHHLLLEDKDVQGPDWKMNPPLRSHADRMALIEGLESGDLDFIANDHAPHAPEEKERSMEQAPFGIVSLETAFPLLYTEFIYKEGRWNLPQLVEWMSTKPARRMGLRDRGEIRTGNRADLVLVDLNTEEIIDKNTFESRGRNTPFDGWKVHAKVRETIVDGTTVWKG